MSRSRKATALLAALLLVGTVLLPASGFAQEADDEEDDREADDEKRRVKIETEGNSVTFELERETGPSEDEIKMEWKAEEATFELEHESENETTETEDELEAVFGALAEYRDADGDGRYDPGEEIVSAWKLGDEFEEEDGIQMDGEATWGPPSIEDVTRDGTQGKLVESTASLGDEAALTLRFLVFGDFVELDGTDLSPTGVKIDIVVEDYAYAANDTDVALFLETETETETELEETDEEEETGVSARDPSSGSTLVFTWKDSAQVDGDSQPVATTVLEEEDETEQEDGESSVERERAFVLSYPRGEEIVHDPRAEVLLQSGASADVPAPGLALLAAVVAAVSAILTRQGHRS